MYSQGWEGIIHSLEISAYISVGSSESWSLLRVALEIRARKENNSVAYLLFLPHCWCGKYYAFSIGQMNVMESSTFEGNLLY